MNSSSSPFPFDLNYNGDQYDDQNHKLYFSSNYQTSSSSNSNSASHLFLNPTRDQHQCFHAQFYQPPPQNADDNCGTQGGSYETEASKGQAETGHKLSLWRKDEKYENQAEKIPGKWMPAKMKLMKKIKSSDHANMEVTNVTAMKFEDQKGPSSSSLLETDQSSNSSSSNNGENVPIVRVCADCNTTKTPLWRSGPKGPKSLCNACGIRQRKARRAMAAAAASTNGTTGTPSSTLNMKVQQKEKTVKSNNRNLQPLKKRCKFATATTELSSCDAKKKLNFEDFLKNLSNSLALHRVFPQDEKDAAILLMAISCGLVHG